MSENKIQNEFQINRYDDDSLLWYVGKISLVSLAIYKYQKNIRFYKLWDLTRIMDFNINIKTLTHSRRVSNGSIVYGSGQLQNKHPNLVSDYAFGVKSLSPNSLGLYRKIEVYTNFHDQTDWFNVNFLNKDLIPSEIEHARSTVFFDNAVTLEGYELSNALLQVLAERESKKKIELNIEDIKKYTEKLLLAQQESVSQNLDANSHLKEMIDDNNNEQILYSLINNQSLEEQLKRVEEVNKLIDLEALHPFQFTSKKAIWCKDNYIYFTKNNNKVTDGDIRISFYDLENPDCVSLLGVYWNEKIYPFQIVRYFGKEDYFKIRFNGGEELVARYDSIGILLRGKRSKYDLADSFKMSITNKKGAGILYIILISAIMFDLCDEFFFSHIKKDDEFLRERARNSISIDDQNVINVKHPLKKSDNSLWYNTIWSFSLVIGSTSVSFPINALIILGGSYTIAEIMKIKKYKVILNEEIESFKAKQILDRNNNKTSTQSPESQSN